MARRRLRARSPISARLSSRRGPNPMPSTPATAPRRAIIRSAARRASAIVGQVKWLGHLAEADIKRPKAADSAWAGAADAAEVMSVAVAAVVAAADAAAGAGVSHVEHGIEDRDNE